MSPIANLIELHQYLKEHPSFTFDDQWLVTTNFTPFLNTLPEKKLAVAVISYAVDNPDAPRKITVSGRLDPAPAWPVANYDNTFLQPVAIELVFTPSTTDIHTALTLSPFDLTLGKLSLRVWACFAEPLSLRVQLAEQPKELRSLADLAQDLNQGLISASLPGGAVGTIFNLVPLTSVEMQLGFAPLQRTSLLFRAETGKSLELFRFDDGRTIAIEKVGAAVETVFSPYQQGEAQKVRAGYKGYLYAVITLGREFDIVISLNGGEDWQLTIQPQGGSLLPDLAALAGMAGGEELQVIVSQGMERMRQLTGLEEFGIDAVRVGFNPYLPELDQVEIDSHLLLKVAGQAIRFETRLRLPDFWFAGELSPGYEVDLKGMVSHYFGEVGVFPEVKITALGTEIAPRHGYFAFHIALENDTELKLSEHVTLKLAELTVSVECFSGSFAGEVKANIVLAREYWFFIKAVLKMDGGCLFQGGLAMDREVPVKGFLTAMGQDFGITMPDMLPDLKVRNLLFAFATSRQAELAQAMACRESGTMGEALPLLLAGNEATTLKLSFSGGFRLGEASADLGLTLQTDADRNVTVGVAATSPAGKPLSAADLFRALIPGEDLQLLQLKDIFDAALEQLEFNLNKKDGIWGSARGEVVIGRKLKVALEVSREKAKDAGWLFTARFGAGSDKPLTISDLLPPELRIIPDEIVSVSVKSGSITVDTGKKEFAFSLTLDSHLDLGGIGRVDCSSLSLRVRMGKEASAHELELSAIGRLKLLDLGLDAAVAANSPLIDFAGEFKVVKKPAADLEISFTAAEGSGGIDLPTLIPGRIGKSEIEWVRIHFQLQRIGIKKTKEWAFDTAFRLSFSNFPEIIGRFLPKEGFTAKLTVDKSGATIALAELFRMEFPFRLPAVENLPAVDLGIGLISIGSISLTLGSKISVEASIQLFLPSRFNYLFGAAGDQPRFEIFDTYMPGDLENKCLALSFHARTGSKNPDVGISITDLPLRPVSKVTIDKVDYWDVKLGRSTTPGRESEYGRILIKVPEFSFDFSKGGFTADGGYILKEDPAIPLQPVKELFKMAGLPQVGDMLPPSVPIPLLDPPQLIKDNKIYVKGIRDFFRTYLKQEIPEESVKVLESLSAHTVETLPTEFTKYLNLSLPAEMGFRIVITPDGGIDVTLQAKPGVRMLLFSPPYFMGVELRGFSFGSLLAGQLFSCRIDADIDQYDIVTLAACMLLQDYKEQIGDTKAFRGKIEIDKLWTIIFYQAGFPVPIPLFYDKLGIDYHGLSDILLQTSFKFPQPELDLTEIVRMCGDLVRFLTDSKFALDPEKIYEKFNLSFTVGPNYLKTGRLLGNRLIGLEKGLPPISAYKILASLLDGIKFCSLRWIIKAIELEYRVGNEKIDFFCLSMQARWLLTTPKEFREGAYVRLGVKPDQIENYLAILPREGDAEGLVAFLQGGWELGGGAIARFDTAFGLIAAGPKGFATALKMEGFIKEVLFLKLQGEFMVDTGSKPPRLLIKGGGQLKFAGLEIFATDGLIRIEENRFKLAGYFRLFKDLPLINIEGAIDGSLDEKGLQLAGDVKTALGPVVLSSARAVVLAHQDYPERGVWINASLLGATVRFALEDRQDRFHLFFSADFRPFAAISVDLEFAKVSPLPKGTITAEIAGFGALRISAESVGTEYGFTVEHLGLVIVNGRSRSSAEAFTLSGGFHLFPDGAPLNVIADANGSFTRSSFHLEGDIRSISLLPGVLSGARAVISSQGVVLGLSFLGQNVGNIMVVDRDGWIVLAFTAKLGPVLSLSPTLSISKNGAGGSASISGGFGDLALDGRITLGAGAYGDYSLRIAGFQLFGGKIHIAPNQFILDGKINFGIIVIDLNGWINGTSIYLKGRAEFGIWPITFGVEVTIDNGLPAVNIWALGLSIKSGLMVYQGQLCFLAAWDTWFFWTRFCNYLIVGPNFFSLVLLQTAYPPDWPLVPASAPAETIMYGAEEVEPLPLLDVVRDLLRFTPGCMPPSAHGDDERCRDVLRSLLGYRFELHSLPDDAGVWNGEAREAVISRTDFADDFFTRLQGQMVTLLIEKGLGKRIERDGIEALFDVGGARAAFRCSVILAGAEPITLILDFKSGGRERRVTVAFDFADPLPAYSRLAAEIAATAG